MKELIYGNRRIRRVGFFGLGRSNLGVYDYLLKKYDGLEFYIRSDKEIPPEAVGRVKKNAKIIYGKDALADINEDILFLSPSVRRDRRELVLAIEKGALLSSDAEFFYSLTDALTFAVSGSDGKSTTTALASLFLTGSGMRSAAIGNIGVAMTPYLDQAIDAAVTELSSFQLMNLTPRAKRALITNVTPNHLNWHTSYEEYLQAKENLLRAAKERAFNLDCPVCAELANRYGADIAYSTLISENELRARTNAEVCITLKDGFITANGCKILDTGTLQCKSKHDISNFAAAIALTYGYAKDESIASIATTFRGLEHRCKSIGTFAGVEYFDSSIDSSPLRTVTTLSGFDGRVHVVLGGRSKGLDYSLLLPILREKACSVTLTGETGELILKLLRDDKALSDAKIEYFYEKDFEAAVIRTAEQAQAGDKVVLSPASTSFDAFKDYAQRGESFAKIIKEYYYKKAGNYNLSPFDDGME